MKKFRVDECENMYGKKVRVKKVSVYNDITHFQDDYYLFYDEDEVYHLESKSKNKIIATFSANSKTNAKELAKQYIF